MSGGITPQDAPLTISYLFSQFPLPTQAFAVSDIAALIELGHRVNVHTMKTARRGEHRRLRNAQVPAELPILRASLSRIWRWPALLLRRRRLVAQMVSAIREARRERTGPSLIVLCCIPRAVEIVEEIEACESDVVHLFWSRHAALVLAALARTRNPKVRTAFVGAYDLVADDLLVRVAIDSAEAVISHAEANRAYLHRRVRGGAPIHIIRRGIPLGVPPDEGERDPHAWITASALVAEKNVEAVLRTFAYARLRRGGLHLTVCGDGPDRKRLQRLCDDLGIAGSVAFLGHIDRTELASLMGRSAAFLMLSEKPSERLPNVVKEALWSGCAVICSRSEGIGELIPDSGIGFVVDTHDTNAMNRAVDQVLGESKEAAERRRARARELIVERFSAVRSMAEYVAVWQACAKAGAPGVRRSDVDVGNLGDGFAA